MILGDILGIGDLITWLVDELICYIETGIILVVNLIIQGLADAVNGILSLLPNMPTLGSFPSWLVNGYDFVAYWFPVDFFFTLGISFVTFYLAWLIASILFRWAKIISGSA